MTPKFNFQESILLKKSSIARERFKNIPKYQIAKEKKIGNNYLQNVKYQYVTNGGTSIQ